MKDETVVFVVEDATSYRCLEPIADRLAAENEIRFLFLDALFEPPNALLGEYKFPKTEVDIPKADVSYPYVEMTEFLKIDYHLFKHLQPHYLNTITQRFVTDLLYDRIYAFDDFFTQIDPSLVLSGVDHLPFLRHLIHEARQRDVYTAVVQQGVHRNHLDPEKVEQFLPHLAATYSPKYDWIEQIKRDVFYRFGPTTYTHPHADIIFTLGDFFTRHIRQLRGQYRPDCSEVITTGTPEFDNPVSEYSPETESVLFLGQQLFERREWWEEDEQRFHPFLEKMNAETTFTYRPHPKSSTGKLENLPDEISISETPSLVNDINDHDVILTFFSTAIYQAIIQGKVAGIVQLPWFPVDFSPFTHDHLIQCAEPTMDFQKSARTRSKRTQLDYLDEFCYMPALDDSVKRDTSLELIIDTLSTRISDL